MLPPAAAPHARPLPRAHSEPADAQTDEASRGIDGPRPGDAAELDQENVARVIRSKIQPPPLRGSTLSRPRLLTRLPAATDKRVTLVIAEAGYGKTTLLADFSSRSHVRCLWYKLDSTDRDSLTLISYLLAAGREIRPDFGAATSKLLSRLAGGDTSADTIVGAFLGEIQGFRDARTVLILDDFHTVDDSAESCGLVSRLIQDAPANLHFVISSRRRPPLALARLAAMGDLAEISTDDLRFSRDETQRLFADAYGQPLDPDVLNEVDARTEGWVASLQLLYSSIRGRPASAARSLARALSGAASPVYDFLAEEVIGHLSPELEQFLVRSALLDRVVPERVVALCADLMPAPSTAQAAAWISEADNLGLLSRGSQTSEARQLHPLLREFLLRQLAERSSSEEVRAMHLRVAVAAEGDDALAACHHYIEAGEPTEAMRCLGQSVVLTMGSGRWGAASQLIGRLSSAAAEPALIAIQARGLFEEGDFAAAAALLGATDLSEQPATVRAVLRQTRLSMGWRSGDSNSVSAVLQEIGEDAETPALLRDIAQVFVDSSPLSAASAPFPDLTKRLQRMAESQARAGYDFYAAISLHNAAIAAASAGQFHDAVALGIRALEAFERLGPGLATSHSTHAVLAMCEFELGRRSNGEAEISLAVMSGEADGDVHAVCAFALALIGKSEDALTQLTAADRLQNEGRSDIAGAMFAGFARSLLQLHSTAARSVEILQAIPIEVPLDLEFQLQHRSLLSSAQLMSGQTEQAVATALDGVAMARRRGGRRFEVRLNAVLAAAEQDSGALVVAVKEAASVGDLALLEVADVIGRSLGMLSAIPAELSESITEWPERWLPVLRRQLHAGDRPSAHVAAVLLDQHGAIGDVGLLRAFDKTYRKRSRAAGLGRALARKVSPKLQIRDLGRVTLAIGERQVKLSTIRRKPASLLMYLVTRPKLTATREQILDELWPDHDPAGASNSLNQSLYFIRREIDPWYEDDVSPEYVCYEAEILWLDPSLTRVSSWDFVSDAALLLRGDYSAQEALTMIDRYPGQFSPEFEYEEWAIAWRTRVHASFLSFASTTIDELLARGELSSALQLAQRSLTIDPTAEDIEKVLIWLYWHTGAKSAAMAQYRRLAASLRADGLDPPDLTELTGKRPRRSRS